MGLIDFLKGNRSEEKITEKQDSGSGQKSKETKKQDLGGEEASAVPNTNRRAWSDFSVLEQLTPERLASVLRQVRYGECPADYLELAQDMEIKDLHYRSVLSTRKDAVCGLEIKVVPADDDGKSLELAEHVKNDIVENTSARLRTLIRDMLDAIAKGFSVNEILWDTTGKIWKPRKFEWKDSRWFQYDRETGRQIMLRDPLTDELYPLSENKFVIHEPHLISGTQIVSGLALPALFYFMLKSYDVTSWAAFIDRYGFPIRIGKYGKKATKEDIQTLKRAIAAIGADFGAVVPESAVIEIVESKSATETSDAYQKMAVWIDKELSKLVLGQTMTTDDGSSHAQSQTHEEVREDICASDAVQIMDTLNSMLVVPYIKFNFGEQVRYPKIQLYKPDEKNIEQVVTAIEKLGPQGLTVKADEVRALLGLTKPEKDDETVGGSTRTPDEPFSMNARRNRPELNAAGNAVNDEDELENSAGSSFGKISGDILAVLEKAAAESKDFESFSAALDRLLPDWKPDEIAELMATAFFQARAAGDSHFEDSAE